MKVTAELANAAVESLDGESVRLGSLWAEKPVVLVFIRHFGCIACQEQVAQLRPYVTEIRRLGAELVIVGNGSRYFGQEFVKLFNLDNPVLVDPALTAYRAAGMQRSLRSIVSARAARNVVRALRAGFRQNSVKGDPWQQGGVLVILPGDELVWSYASAVLGDHPDPAEALKALTAARG